MGKESGVIVAKAKAMHGGALRKEAYDELLRKRSVSEIAGYLKNETYFAVALKDVRENNVHRGQLENILRRDLFWKTLKLYRYASSSQQAIYRFHLEQIEIELLLSRIRVLISQNYEDAISDLPLFLKDYTRFSLIKLGNTRSYDEVLEVLKRTGYYEALLPYRVAKGKEENIDYTAIETQLHKLYYTHIFDTIEHKMKGNDRKSMREFFTIELDLSNLTKIYRLKKYFNAREDVIRESLLFVDGYKAYSNMEELIAQKSADDVLKKLQQGKYHIDASLKEFEFIEHYINKIMYSIAKKNFAYSQSTPLVFHSFVKLLQQELENIINIIEGVRYQVPAEDIQKELIY